MFNRVVNEDGLRSFFATRQNHLEGYAIEIEKDLEGPVNERNIDPPECPDNTFDERSSLERAIAEALKMYDCGSYTIAEITNKTGISKSAIYGALAKRILDI
jgi:hypothetical protein